MARKIISSLTNPSGISADRGRKLNSCPRIIHARAESTRSFDSFDSAALPRLIIGDKRVHIYTYYNRIVSFATYDRVLVHGMSNEAFCTTISRYDDEIVERNCEMELSKACASR